MPLSRRHVLQFTAGGAALMASTCLASAQSYPERPIRLVVPFPPGGAYDGLGRPWADRIKPLLGTVVVQNAPISPACSASRGGRRARERALRIGAKLSGASDPPRRAVPSGRRL